MNKKKLQTFPVSIMQVWAKVMIDVRCKQIASTDVKLTVAEVKNV